MYDMPQEHVQYVDLQYETDCFEKSLDDLICAYPSPVRMAALAKATADLLHKYKVPLETSKEMIAYFWEKAEKGGNGED